MKESTYPLIFFPLFFAHPVDRAIHAIHSFIHPSSIFLSTVLSLAVLSTLRVHLDLQRALETPSVPLVNTLDYFRNPDRIPLQILLPFSLCFTFRNQKKTGNSGSVVNSFLTDHDHDPDSDPDQVTPSRCRRLLHSIRFSLFI